MCPLPSAARGGVRTNQNVGLREGRETAPGSARSLRYPPICVRRTDKWIHSEQDPPHPQEHLCPALTLRIHTHRPVRCHTHQLRSPRAPRSNGSRQGPFLPTPVSQRQACACRVPAQSRARAELKMHSDLVSRTPTGPGASAGLRKMRAEEARTQQLPPCQLLLSIRPTQLPGLEWI